jgi:hypothetical protein
VVAAVVIVAYSWWAAGVHPFTALSYELVAIPSLLAVTGLAAMGAFSRRRVDITNYCRLRASNVSLSSIAPWLVVLLCAVVLEGVGLALGGRSQSVPTLSTTVDHLLVTRLERSVLYVAWLLVGANSLWRLWRQRQPGSH